MLSMANVLIVGGAGYVGGAITDSMRMRKDLNVRVYDYLLYESEYRKDVDFVFGDIRDTNKLKEHLDWADVVVWLAALVGDGACTANPHLTVEINQESVRWLADNFDRRIIFMSTCSVYGANEELLTEDSTFDPLSLYAETKLKAESRLTDSSAMIFRLGTLFGISDNYSRIRMDLVVNTLVAKAFYYKNISVFGGEQYRPLLHVKDVAEAVITNLETEHLGPYNLHHSNIKIAELAEMVAEYFPDIEVHRTEMKFEDSRNYRVSSDKAREAFGFNPKYTPSHGIVEVKTLLEEGRIRDINNPRYSNTESLRNYVSGPRLPIGYELPRSI